MCLLATVQIVTERVASLGPSEAAELAVQKQRRKNAVGAVIGIVMGMPIPTTAPPACFRVVALSVNAGGKNG